jgi:flagellar basal body rod protein FlgG
MVRSLWTAATGMIAQQTNLDTIANNLANVNTQGYKTQVNEFKTLLYQTLQTKTTSANGTQKPTSAQVGLGVRNIQRGECPGFRQRYRFPDRRKGFLRGSGRGRQYLLHPQR